jgi:hypothetical protein
MAIDAVTLQTVDFGQICNSPRATVSLLLMVPVLPVSRRHLIAYRSSGSLLQSRLNLRITDIGRCPSRQVWIDRNTLKQHNKNTEQDSSHVCLLS